MVNGNIDNIDISSSVFYLPGLRPRPVHHAGHRQVRGPDRPGAIGRPVEPYRARQRLDDARVAFQPDILWFIFTMGRQRHHYFQGIAAFGFFRAGHVDYEVEGSIAANGPGHSLPGPTGGKPRIRGADTGIRLLLPDFRHPLVGAAPEGPAALRSLPPGAADFDGGMVEHPFHPCPRRVHHRAVFY